MAIGSPRRRFQNGRCEKTGLHSPIGAERLTEVKLPDNVAAASLKIDVFAYKHLWFSNAVSVKKKFDLGLRTVSYPVKVCIY